MAKRRRNRIVVSKREDRGRSISVAITRSLSLKDSLYGCAWHDVLVCRRPCLGQWKWSIVGNVSCDISRLIDKGYETHRPWRSAVEEADHGSTP